MRKYIPGELFGEKALLDSTVRAATITASGDGVRVWMLSRRAFEAKFGPLSQLKAEQYLADPRSGIANFYGKGDSKGPAGTLAALADASAAKPTSWFAVYRPCSRDSIAKMVGRVGTGKGLNVLSNAGLDPSTSGLSALRAALPSARLSSANPDRWIETRHRR